MRFARPGGVAVTDEERPHSLDFTIELRRDEKWVVVTCRRCEISVHLPLGEHGELPAALGELARQHSPEGHREAERRRRRGR